MTDSTLKTSSQNGAEVENKMTETSKLKSKATSTKGPIRKVSSKSKGSLKKGSNSSRVAARKVLKAKKKALAIRKRQKTSAGDKLVCGYGQNLGLLQGDQSCRSVHLTKCRNMVKRDVSAPRYSKAAAIRSQIARMTGKGRYGRLRRKKWSLKGRRRYKVRMAKIRNRNNKAKRYRQKLSKAQLRKNALRKSAKKMLDKMLDSTNPIWRSNGVKKMAKRLTNKRTFNKIKNQLNKGALKRLLRTPLARKIIEKHNKLKKNEDEPVDKDAGDHCVHAVQYNLNYCCYFTSRSEAQMFANTQPDEETFDRMLMEGRRAAKRDREKRARRAAAKARKALALLKANKKHQNKRNSKKGSYKTKAKANKNGKSEKKLHKALRKGGKKH